MNCNSPQIQHDAHFISLYSVLFSDVGIMDSYLLLIRPICIVSDEVSIRKQKDQVGKQIVINKRGKGMKNATCSICSCDWNILTMLLCYLFPLIFQNLS